MPVRPANSDIELKGQRHVSTPYGYDGRLQDRVAPPPGVLPPPQQTQWQAGPPPQYAQRQYGQPQYGQSQYYGQPYYGGPQQFNGFQPPPKRGGAIRLVLLGFTVVALLGIGLAVVGVVLTGGLSSSDTATPQVDGPSVVPTATTKPPKGSAEDYLLNAPIYQSGGLGEQNCPAEKLGDGSLAAQKVYYEKLFKCLNDAWRPVFTKIGKNDPDPSLVVFDKPVQTSCGRFEPLSGRVLAFYCYGNKVMYTDVQQMNKAFGPKQDLAYLLTIAHEYGHHIQGVTDLFYARAVYLQDHPDEKLDSSRRNELQASCFAGVFSRSVARSYPFTSRLNEFEQQAGNSFGDSSNTPEAERTHGLASSQGFWITNGLNVGESKACNTFAAQADQVR
ncbi:neutral zinc metallopeptidase [Kribbella sp. CA-293567]|uniref:neutral zinc metallopeptidase n=1 Tax=Kribbella sp. CA-293567 TaxID=3002436 RepID=UPI0022DE085A|nr:neutral zinc metallopeptidase [Kribbella sp. CA-293567]WBQ04551.1 neutral zinc metallopeptidase [Kribbella sp. CA-293567]